MLPHFGSHKKLIASDGCFSVCTKQAQFQAWIIYFLMNRRFSSFGEVQCKGGQLGDM